MGNQEWTLQRNWQHRIYKTKTGKANCVEHHHTQDIARRQTKQTNKTHNTISVGHHHTQDITRRQTKHTNKTHNTYLLNTIIHKT